MKALFENLKSKLAAIEGIRFVDLQNQQLNEETPPVSFPCVLIDLDNSIEFKTLSSRKQIALVRFVFTVAFVKTTKTDNLVNRNVLNWHFLNSIHNVLKAEGLERTAIKKQKRNDFDVFDIYFQNTYTNLIV